MITKLCIGKCKAEQSREQYLRFKHTHTHRYFVTNNGTFLFYNANFFITILYRKQKIIIELQFCKNTF